MNRILEINPSQEEAVVSRVLLLVHQAIDERFPNLQNTPRQFTKTVFSDDSSEKTAQQYLPAEAYADDEQHDIPPPPIDRSKKQPKAEKTAQSSTAESAPITAPSAKSRSNKVPESELLERIDTRNEGENFSRSTRLGTEMESLKPDGALSDWSTRITVALLIAGIVLLVYAILA